MVTMGPCFDVVSRIARQHFIFLYRMATMDSTAQKSDAMGAPGTDRGLTHSRLLESFHVRKKSVRSVRSARWRGVGAVGKSFRFAAT